MQSTGPAKASWRSSGSGRAGTHSGPPHDGLAGANRTTVDGLSGNHCRTASGQPGPRSLRLHLTGRRTRLLQPCHHVGTRRHNRPRRRLTSQTLTRLRPQGRARRRHCGLDWHRRRPCFGRRLRAWRGSGPGHWSSWNRNRRRRHWRGRRSRWYGLSRPRQDLPRSRRRDRTSRNRTGAQRGMQRRHATSRQRRPQRRRLAAERFFNDGNGGLLGGCDGWFNNRCGWFWDHRNVRRRRFGPSALFDSFRFCNGHGAVGFTAGRVATPALQALPYD
jgi:hypothetical protein